MPNSSLIPPLANTDILVVDDNATVLKALRKAFRQIKPDLRIHQSQTPQDAEEKISHSFYKIIFVDMIMQNNETAGLELIEKIATQTRGVIILYTAYACDPVIRERIEKKSEQYQNFPFFIQQKEGDYQKLEELLTYYVALDPDLPPAFLDLIREIEGDIQASKNRQVFEQGRIFAKGLEKLEALRQELKEEIKRLSSKKSDSPRLELLQRQYNKIKGEWHHLLSEHLPNAPTATTLWWYYQYYQEFSTPRLYPHLEKIKISQYRKLYTIFRFSTPIAADPIPLKERKDILNAQERAYFYDLIETTPQESLNALFQMKNLINYLELRKKLWEQQADIPPEFVFRVATQYTLTGVKTQLPKLITAWQEGGVKRLQEQIAPIHILSDSVEKLAQLQQNLRDSTSISPTWQLKPHFQIFESDDVLDALNQLESSSLVIAIDKLIPEKLLRQIVINLIPQLKNGQYHRIYSLDIIDAAIYTKTNFENFLLQSAELMNIQKNPQGKKIVFIVQSSLANILEQWSQQWQAELKVSSTAQTDQFVNYFYDTVKILNTPTHFFIIKIS